jgi:hypothetical protein
MSKSAESDNLIHECLKEKAETLKSANKASIDKKVAVSAVRDLIVVEELDKTLSKVFSKGWCSPPKYSGKRKHAPYKRIVNSILSDLHFGSHLDPAECPLEYGVVQESRRLGKVAQEVADYKEQYRDETKLIIHLIGDCMQGQLHDLRDGEPLALQFAAATHYLTQYIMLLCGCYPSVEIYTNPGNHGRNLQRHPERAVHQKFDSIENMMYYAVKKAVLNSGVKNCQFNIPKTPYYIAPLFNNKLFGTHGDTVLKPGYPGKSINIASLAQQIYKWNAAGDIGGPFRVFAVGHLHIAGMTELPGKVTMITNGALVPSDAYSLSIGSPDLTCGQWIFESVEKHPVGDRRFIEVNGAENDSNYNSIITPFEGF